MASMPVAAGMSAPAAAAASAPAAAAPRAPSQTVTAVLDRELQSREARVAESERRIAEQQRVLMESYRLLRDVREKPAAAAQPAAAPRPAWPPSRPAPSEQTPGRTLAPRIADESTSVHGFSEGRVLSETFWARLRRTLFGAGKPVVEDWRY